ncbi:MAG TPA: hypothetical protein PKC21_09840 [Oligoflexia bacterium]|nr:hypothetical protein [Oligoflexia bacterium]HMR25640.1 hypothetical protein [Oligoflexia bacterium]
MRYKVNILSHSIVVLCSYFILQMGFDQLAQSNQSLHAMLWFIILYLMVFVGLSISDRYRKNAFEKGLILFTSHRHQIFIVKIIIHLLLLMVPIVLLFSLLALQGICFSTQTYWVYVMGIVLLSVMSQILTGLLAQLPNKTMALPLLFFPCSAPVSLFLFSVVIKSTSTSINQELFTCFGMILIALSIGYMTSEISLEE